MITKIKLKNFQAHENLTIELGQVTTIVGPTDAGKSAIVRAIRWLFFNKPSGDGHLHWGASEVAVKLKAEKQTITRTKSKPTNEYKLGDKVYKAFGAGVPPAIVDLLGVSEENIQHQTDPHFWLSATPGQVGKELNAIVSLDIIDRALAYLDRGARKSKLLYSVSTENKRLSKEKFKRLSYIPSMYKAARLLECKHIKYTKDTKQSKEIEGWVGAALVNDNIIKEGTKTLKAAKGLARLGNAQHKAQQGAHTLRGLVNRATTAQVAANRDVPSMGCLAALKLKTTSIKATSDGCAVMIVNILEAKDTVTKTKTKLANAVVQFDGTKEKGCPLCLRPY